MRPELSQSAKVPVLAEASVIAAGIMGMPAGRVMLVTGLANLGFAGVYAGLGASAEGTSGFLLAFAASLQSVLPAARLGQARLHHERLSGADPRICPDRAVRVSRLF